MRYTGPYAKNMAVRRVFTLYKSQAKQRKLDFELSLTQLGWLVTSPCFWCGADFSNQLQYRGETFLYSGIDRLDNAKGYLPDNVVPSCRGCNSLRAYMRIETWLGFLHALTNHNAENPERIKLIADSLGIEIDEDYYTKRYVRAL